MTAEQRIKPAPIRKRLRVRSTPERAFDLFLSNMASWWLPNHTLLQVPVKAIVIEPRAAGSWYELGEDDSEQKWGRVVEWDPPRRALLLWQLNAEFTFDPAFETHVEVTFTPDGDHTLVDFEHRDLERYGAAVETLGGGLDRGWGELLASYAKAAGD